MNKLSPTTREFEFIPASGNPILTSFFFNQPWMRNIAVPHL